MVERVFLGWNEPFVGLASEWLLAAEWSPENSLVVVPTAQSARQLKHRMAQQAGALLSPQFTTPGSMMRLEDPDIAPDWLESLAWQDVLEQQISRETLESLFSESAQTQDEWAGGLASEMLSLRRSLQDNGLMLRDLARRLSSSPEGERWSALSEIEAKVEQWIRKQGRRSRSDSLRRGINLPNGLNSLILAGVSELPPLVERNLLESGIPITCLIAAPDSKKELFTEIGTPTTEWTDECIDWPEPHGSVEVNTDPKQQAHAARSLVAKAKTTVEELTLGSADTQTGDLLAKEFSSAGWPSYHPATITVHLGLRRWLQAWSQWLTQPDLSTVANLLSLPQTQLLIEADCADIAHSLSELRDRWMVLQPDDLRHQLKHGNHYRLKSEAVDVLRACEKLEKWRKLCEGKDIAGNLRHLLDAVDPESTETSEFQAWLDEASDHMNSSKRSMSFWIDLMLLHLPTPATPPPHERALDVHGWLELLFQPGSHMVLCGLNEGSVPASKADDPWLGESARELLELHTNRNRAARDAFLLQSMIQSRVQSGGRADLLCARSNEKGEPSLPSRLLLAANKDDIPARVERLFQELEPADAKLRWEIEENTHWQTPPFDSPTTLNATSFRDYLACPFRYQLKHIHRMHGSEPERIEWNARDFGNVIHNVLEAWGADEIARELIAAKDIQHWLNQQLDRQVQHIFNQRIPLAVRIQLDAMRQRLSWFALTQQSLMEEGWRVTDVELDLKTTIGEATISTKIDRIDRHRDTGELRIIDYKTGGTSDSASAAHRTTQRSNSKLPEHIKEDDPALYEKDDGKKVVRYLWKDLQLPLYTLAVQSHNGQLATPCYFRLGETAKDVALTPWSDFDELDLEAARQCAEWISQCISDKRFGPVAEKPRYDDYALLWCDRSPEEVLTAIGD